MSENKMQIRATVFASINNVLSSVGLKEEVLNDAVNTIKTIEDKDFLAKLLIKEFINTNESDRTSLISLILLNCVPIEILEQNLWKNLALKEISDEKKYQLVEILKSMGKFIEYDKYLDYFEEPQKVIDIDTNKLLSSAMLNPEAQIDFLDFMETLSTNDKILLIQSMVEDYTKDDLANIISPIILCEKNREILELIIKELINSKSPIAYYPLKRFSELSKDDELLWLVNKGLKEFQLAGINEEKAKEFYLKRFGNSLLCNCYSSIPDGRGNQALIFSRIRSDNSIQIFCVVTNDILGITDCFGFNTISQLELSLIVKKFSNNEIPMSATFETGLAWLKEAEKISFEQNNVLPYEYACWREIIFDVPNQEAEPKEIIEKALAILPKKDCNLDEIFQTTYLDKLFLTKNDNENFISFINETDDYIANSNDFNLKNIEKKIKENVTKIFDENTKEIFIKRLQKIGFLLMANSKHNLAAEIYELSKNDELLNKFFEESLKKSIFVFYEQEFQRKYADEIDNIFIRNAKKYGTKISEEKLKTLLSQILTEWGTDD